mmetsp:Transcript_52030/g.131516  ORF Transcript_52030/g.131516 Transcript_52030/m.131516 type:complete len:304 (-) Transcript_52030:987-1898(-)
MVFPNEDRHGRKVLVVAIQEQALEAAFPLRGVGGVHAVLEARPVRRPEVVPRLVADGLGVAHGPPELSHLPEAREAAVAQASPANAKGEGGSEVGPGPNHAHLLLCIQHAVECAHEGSAKQGGLLRWEKLEVWLIHEDDHPQSRMVCLIAQVQETLLQVPCVCMLDLLVAIVVGFGAIPGHLEVGPIAQTGQNMQALRLGLVQEGQVVDLGVVAVEPHGIGSERLDHAQIVPAVRAPQCSGPRRHEVVVRQLERPLERRRRIADSLHHLALPAGLPHVRRGGGCRRCCGSCDVRMGGSGTRCP